MLSNDEPFAYAEVYRGDVSWGSANYRFDERQIVPWAWREFIATIDDNDTSRQRNASDGSKWMSDLEIVVTGPNGDAKGVTGMYIEADTSSRDYQRKSRNHPLTPHGKKLFMWNFVVKREDGSYCRLRPHHKENSVAYMDGRFNEDVKHYKSTHLKKRMKFDPKKFT